MNLNEEISLRGKLATDYLLEYGRKHINPEDPLRQAALHYLKGGGKGFRPAMLQLVCGALGGDESKAIAPSAAIEALHVSSLIHDDYMDQDKTRRGVSAVWSEWDPTIAILAGDVLSGIAFTIVGNVDGLADDLKYTFTRELAQIYTKLCEGQMYDISFETTPFEDLTQADVTGMQYLKTGVLFEFSCITGARLALKKTEDPLIDLIREYAQLSGTAFQIQDDLMGIIGDSKEIGKPVGSDILTGKRTVIAVHAVTNGNERQRNILLETLGNRDASAEQINVCISTMEEIGSIQYAKLLAKDMAEKAIKLTAKLPQNFQTSLLAEFAKYMIERNL